MKLFRERPDQRQHHRVMAPIFVGFEGDSYRADNWSLGGLTVSNVNSELPKPGDEIKLDIAIPFQGFDIRFAADVKVVRIDEPDKMFAGRFLELGERERDLMQLFIEDLIRGSMSDAGDTIQRIDVPLTPISTKPDVDPGFNVPIRRWSRKTVFMTAFYILSGFCIFGYLALMVYTNFIKLEIRSAIVTRPIIIAKALADGRIQTLHYRTGDKVKKGDLIAELYVPDIQNDVNEALVEITRLQGSLARAKKALGNGKRLSLTEKQIGARRLDVSKEEDELKAAELHAEMLRLSVSDHHIRAPFDARIVELRKPSGSTFIYKEPILILERLGPPSIEAYVTQEQAMKIALEDTASFYIPSLKFKGSAKIVSVNRSSNNLDEVASRYFWQNQDAKSALVKMEINGGQGMEVWPAGLPATVSFNRHRDSTPILKGGRGEH